MSNQVKSKAQIIFDNADKDLTTDLIEKMMEEYAAQFRNDQFTPSNEKVMKKPRCEKELCVEKYFGLAADCNPDGTLTISYATIVNLLYQFEQNYMAQALKDSMFMNGGNTDAEKDFYAMGFKAGASYRLNNEHPSSPE